MTPKLSPTIRVSLLLLLVLCDEQLIPIKIHYVEANYKESNPRPVTGNSEHTDKNHDNPRQAEFHKAFEPSASATDVSKLKLAILVDDKMDGNNDGSVVLEELVSWLRKCQNKYIEEDVNRHWVALGKTLDDNSLLLWSDYLAKEHGHFNDIFKYSHVDESDDNNLQKARDGSEKKDERRWKAADINLDGKMSRDEFKLFLYPETSEVMQKLMIDEKFETMDTNKDGRISMDEFLSDLRIEEGNIAKRDEWLNEGRARFASRMDINHDNFLDKSEIAGWISESELSDHSLAEARHLIQNADLNSDDKLSKEEILSAYYEFVNSHATNFGEALKSEPTNIHSEL